MMSDMFRNFSFETCYPEMHEEELYGTSLIGRRLNRRASAT